MANINENGNFIGARTKSGIKEWFQKGLFDISKRSEDQQKRTEHFAKTKRRKPVDYLLNSLIFIIGFGLLFFVCYFTFILGGNFIFIIIFSLIWLGVNSFKTYKQVLYWEKFDIFSMFAAIATSLVSIAYTIVFCWLNINPNTFWPSKNGYTNIVTAPQWIGIVINVIGSISLIILIWYRWKEYRRHYGTSVTNTDGLTEEEAEKEILRRKMVNYSSKS